MLRISVLAAILLKEALSNSNIQPEKGLRLHRHDGLLVLKSDSLHPDDRILWHSGKPLIIVSPDLADELGDALIDIDESNGENTLVLRRKTRG